jgi:hypothetical protein
VRVFELSATSISQTYRPSNLTRASPSSLSQTPQVAATEGKEAIIDLIVNNSTLAPLAKAPCPAALLKATMYGHTTMARTLQRVCNVSAASPKLQAAGWLGALFNAARGGHTKVAQLLLADPDAGEMLTKVYADQKPKKGAPPRPPNPEKDPIAVAAARGHLAIVQALSPHRALCAPCAAVAAAAAGHKDVFVHLVEGPAGNLLEVG